MPEIETIQKATAEPIELNEQKMIYLNGSKTSFRCVCGANVFTKFQHKRYRCNSCDATYTGE